MANKKKNLRQQVRALEALAGLEKIDDESARNVNGGLGAAVAPIKLRRGTGAVAVRRGTGAVAIRRGTGAIAQRIGGTGALLVRGTGAVAVIGKGA